MDASRVVKTNLLRLTVSQLCPGNRKIGLSDRVFLVLANRKLGRFSYFSASKAGNKSAVPNARFKLLHCLSGLRYSCKTLMRNSSIPTENADRPRQRKLRCAAKGTVSCNFDLANGMPSALLPIFARSGQGQGILHFSRAHP